MSKPPLFDTPPQTDLAVEHLTDLTIHWQDPLQIQTPLGLRLTYFFNGGTLNGILAGELLPGGGDWVIVDANGHSRLEVMAAIRTHDGALIHFGLRGIVTLPPDGVARLERGETIAWDEAYMRTTPTFETSDPRYVSLSSQIFIGVNELSPGTFCHRIYRVL